MPWLYTRLHASSVLLVPGVLPLALVQAVHGDVFLAAPERTALPPLVTTAVSSHMIAHTAFVPGRNTGLQAGREQQWAHLRDTGLI